jgi:hypothetical protein
LKQAMSDSRILLPRQTLKAKKGDHRGDA